MPVHIRDFSVETNGQGAPGPAAPPAAPQTAQPRPLSDRQIAELIKAGRRRAARLHAD